MQTRSPETELESLLQQLCFYLQSNPHMKKVENDTCLTFTVFIQKKSDIEYIFSNPALITHCKDHSKLN